MKFYRFVLTRVGVTVLVMFGVVTLAFAVSHLIPVDPIRAVVGPKATPEQIEMERQRWGLDKPLYVQYVIFWEELFHGRLGRSIWSGRPVEVELAQRFPATAELTLASALLAIGIGIPMGAIAATRRNEWPDHVVRGLSIFGLSVPDFWLGLILLYIFYGQFGFGGLGRLSVGVNPPAHITGMFVIDSLLTGNWQTLTDSVSHLIMPAVTLSLFFLAVIARMTRSSMLEVLNKPYIAAARVKGLGERKVIYKHAMRNALIPTITTIGFSFGLLLGGAIVVETVFTWPGLGYLAYQSVLKMDIPFIMGLSLLMALIYSTANLLVDIAYGFLDPRIRY
jgi:peptide/nickel transport system permease protein